MAGHDLSRAVATSGWVRAVYPAPDHITTLDTSSAFILESAFRSESLAVAVEAAQLDLLSNVTVTLPGAIASALGMTLGMFDTVPRNVLSLGQTTSLTTADRYLTQESSRFEQSDTPQWVVAATAKLAQLRVLPTDWDRVGGFTVERSNALAALRFLSEVMADDLALPVFLPMRNGGVQLEWEVKNSEVVFTAAPDEPDLVWVRAGDRIVGNTPGAARWLLRASVPAVADLQVAQGATPATELGALTHARVVDPALFRLRRFEGDWLMLLDRASPALQAFLRKESLSWLTLGIDIGYFAEGPTIFDVLPASTADHASGSFADTQLDLETFDDALATGRAELTPERMEYLSLILDAPESVWATALDEVRSHAQDDRFTRDTVDALEWCLYGVEVSDDRVEDTPAHWRGARIQVADLRAVARAGELDAAREELIAAMMRVIASESGLGHESEPDSTTSQGSV